MRENIYRIIILLAALTGGLFFPPATAAQTAQHAKIAFAGNRDGNWKIYLMDADGSNPVRLTHNAASDVTPAWSPDRASLLFVSNRTGNEEIFRLLVGRDSQEENLTNNPTPEKTPAFSPNGQFIVFASNREDSPYEIYRMDANGYNVVRLTANNANEVHPCVAAGRITFQSGRHTRPGDQTANDDVFSINPDGSGLTALITGAAPDRAATLSAEGRRLAFSTSRDGQFDILEGESGNLKTTCAS